MKKSDEISFFQRYLTFWVLICMIAGILIGKFLTIITKILTSLNIFGISVPITILIWLMIYPMMLKINFQSLKQIGKNPEGLFLTWTVNWMIKPFSMFAISYIFLCGYLDF